VVFVSEITIQIFCFENDFLFHIQFLVTLKLNSLYTRRPPEKSGQLNLSE
jgi:hypothetical protein